MSPAPKLCSVLATAVLVAGCATAGEESAGQTTEPTATPSAASTAPAAQDGQFEVVQDEDIVYHTGDGEDLVMDVLHPDGGGPWPLVVIYHGRPAGPSITEARRIAARGAVAVAPTWANNWDEVDREDYIDGALFDRAACAVGKSQQIAADFGADPTNTTVAGFSAGMHPAGWVGLGAMRDDVCATPLAHQPVGLVLGDSQFLFYESGWDESFADPASNASDTTDRFLNPQRWDVPDDLAVYLWTSDYRHGRDVENPPATDSWLWARDTTGTLEADLAALDAIEDEWIDWSDNARLMELRMKTAGIDVIHEAVGGGHSYSEPVYDALETIMTGGR